MRESDGEEVNMMLKNNIEGIILKWARQVADSDCELSFTVSPQVDEVLTKESSEELDLGNNPGPMTEIEFWEAKRINLESLFEQVSFQADI